MSPERRWLDENSKQFAGKWVALLGGKLIASGDSAQEVYCKAEVEGVTFPLVVKVPFGEELPFAGW